MSYRTHQNLLLITSFLLLALLMLSPFLERWARVGGLSQRETETVNAAITVNVWVNKKTGLYYCPGSTLYGKANPGAYMTEERALEGGYRPAAHEACKQSN